MARRGRDAIFSSKCSASRFQLASTVTDLLAVDNHDLILDGSQDLLLPCQEYPLYGLITRAEEPEEVWAKELDEKQPSKQVAVVRPIPN